jgi:hypothetical protein
MTDLKDFVDDGFCTQIGGEMFFTDQAGDHTSKFVKKLCTEQCPVVEQCFSWAMAQGSELHGTWAGTTWRERTAAHVARTKKRAAA